MILKTEFSQPKHLHFRGNTRIFALFFMVLDLRLVKIGCRDDNQFFLLPTLPAPHHVLAYTPNNRLFVRALHAVLFTLMAAKAINAHQCFARRVRSTLWNSH